MKCGRSIVLALLTVPSVSLAQDSADFRLIPGMREPMVIDVESIASEGDIRTFDTYMRYAHGADGINMRARFKINCRERTQSLAGIAKEDSDGSGFGPLQSIEDIWGKTDTDETGTLIANLVCAQPGDRDRYARRMAETDWPSALAAAAKAISNGKQP